MIRILWILAFLSALAGFAIVAVSISFDSAPQQAAAAGVGIGFIAGPYVMLRALESIFGDRATKRLVDAINGKGKQQ